MIIVDSSFLVAFFNSEDDCHDKAIQEMKKYDEKKEEFMITEHILGETATVILYKKGLDAAKEFLDFAQQKCFIQGWENDDFQATLKYFKNQKHQLSYIDASIVFLARFLQCPVATYDEDIIKEIKKE